MSESIYNDEDKGIYDGEEGMPRPSTASNVQKITNLLGKRRPVAIILAGVTEWASPVEVVQVESDAGVFPMLRVLVNTNLVVVNPTDIKIPSILSLLETLHVELFCLNVDIAHEMTGIAKSLLAHLPVINQIDFEQIISFTEADMIARDLEKVVPGTEDMGGDDL